MPQDLVADASGGLYFTTWRSGAGESQLGAVYYRDADGAIRPAFADSTLQVKGLALGDGVLFATAAGDTAVWAMAVAADGSLAQRRAFAELFRADGRYGAEAVEKLAGEAGLETPKETSRDRARVEEQISLYTVLEEAAKYFKLE